MRSSIKSENPPEIIWGVFVGMPSPVQGPALYYRDPRGRTSRYWLRKINYNVYVRILYDRYETREVEPRGKINKIFMYAFYTVTNTYLYTFTTVVVNTYILEPLQTVGPL